MTKRKEHKIINGVECKECSSCKKILPVDIEHFAPRKLTRDGFNGRCRICCSIHNKQYCEQNKEKVAKSRKKYSAEHKEESKKYRKEHREESKKYKKQYYIDNKDKISNGRKIYYLSNRAKIISKAKQWYEVNKEHKAIYDEQYNEKNKDRISKRKSNYKKNNRIKFTISNQRREARKKQLPETLTIEQWEKVKQYFNNKCAYCGRELPLAQEHVVPVAKGGEYTHDNIICACQSCNSSKNDRDFLKWYRKYRYYSKKREKLILKYLNYDKNNIQQLSIL